MFGKTKKLKQTISEVQFMLSEKNKELEQLKKNALALRYYSRVQHGDVFAQMPGFWHKSDNAGY